MDTTTSVAHRRQRCSLDHVAPGVFQTLRFDGVQEVDDEPPYSLECRTCACGGSYSRPFDMAPIAGDVVTYGDELNGFAQLRCLGEQNTTWCQYIVFSDASGAELYAEAASFGGKPPAKLVTTCWVTRLLAIVYAVARAASVVDDCGDLDVLFERARMTCARLEQERDEREAA